MVDLVEEAMEDTENLEEHILETLLELLLTQLAVLLQKTKQFQLKIEAECQVAEPQDFC